MKKIKVLHIQETIGAGGVERRRLSLAKLLNKSKFEQQIICTNAAGNIVEEIENEGVKIFSLGVLKSLFQWSQHKKVQKIIDDFKPDIIHGAVFEGVIMAVINGWLKKVPIIIIEETSDPQNRTWRGNLLMKFFSIFSEKVIGVSEAVTKEYLKDKLKLPSSKILLINNGVAMPRELGSKEVDEAKLKYSINEDDFVIGTIGRMLSDSNKRFSDMIHAFAVFAKNKKNVKLLMVGDGPEMTNYKQLASELKISDKIIFIGYHGDVTLFYNMMHVFSLVSANESFGLVLAEAMLNKLPVVATKVGGMKYIVDHERTGFLVERFNVNQIAEKFEILYHDKDLCQKMGIEGYGKALIEYTEEVYAGKIEALYLELFKAKNQ